MEKRQNYIWNWTRFTTSMMRTERWALVILIISLFRDNFKSEYDDKAWIIWIAHLLGIIICVFCDVLKQRLNNSNFKVSKDGVEITKNDKDTK